MIYKEIFIKIFLILIGVILSVLLIKIIIPKPKRIRILPTLQNYKKTTFIDEDGKYYHYDLKSIQLERKNVAAI